MPKKPNEKVVEPTIKDYDINWLRGLPKHPDYHLVVEFDAKQAKEVEKEDK